MKACWVKSDGKQEASSMLISILEGTEMERARCGVSGVHGGRESLRFGI